MGLDVDEAARISAIDANQIEDYESGSAVPGLDALESLSETYRCPVGYFFLESPPEVEAALSMRGLQGRKLEALHYETLARIEQFLSLTDLAARLVDQVGGHREIGIGQASLEDPIQETARRERLSLHVPGDVQDSTLNPDTVFLGWKKAIEDKGVIVITLQLNPADIRGASRWQHPSVPAILVNREDAEASTGRTFTLLHEWVHLLTRRAGVVCDFEGHAAGARLESFANAVAAEILVPREDLRALLRRQGLLEWRCTWPDRVLDEIRVPFGASRHVVAILIEQMDLAPRGFYASRRAIWETRRPFFRSTAARRVGHTKRQRRLASLGAPFVTLVSEAYDAGAMSKLDMAEVFDLKVEQVEEFANWVRGEWRRPADRG